MTLKHHPSGSTSSALIAILHKAYSPLDNVKIVAISLISFDIRKAFDRVNHSLLLSKLSKILPYNFVSILASYLSQRKQRLKINNSYSKYININCGVPQGSVLSAIFCNVFSKSELILINNTYIFSKILYTCHAFINLPQKLNYHFLRLYKRAHHSICGHECKRNCLIKPPQTTNSDVNKTFFQGRQE